MYEERFRAVYNSLLSRIPSVVDNFTQEDLDWYFGNELGFSPEEFHFKFDNWVASGSAAQGFRIWVEWFLQWKDQWYNDRYKPFIGRVSEPEWFKNIVFVYMFPGMLSGVDFGIISEIDKLLEEINTQLHQFLALALDKLGESLSDSDKVVELCMDASFDELIMALWTAKRGLNQSFHRYDEIMALCKEDLQGVFDLPIPSGVLNQQDLLRSLC